jgi:HlyD family secretion protein
MAGGTSVTLLHDIQVLFDAGTASGLSDRQLLERFIGRGDASAFEVLVLRHGPMVLRVCRNRLRDPNDAQDAFQATFLILVRRSGSIRRLDSLGSWLYGVASRVSARVRTGAARRRGAEERAAARVLEAVDTSGGIEVDREEFGPIVQEEVRRLPEKYRAAVVLCYWEGLTHEQAAVQLGVPLGTVRSRMARARDLLRRRLTRRGLASMPGVIAILLDGSSATASLLRLAPIPAELVQATVRAAAQVAAGQATGLLVSGVVASLVQRVIWSMTMIKVSGVAAGVVLVALVGYGVGTAAQQAGRLRSVAPLVQVVDAKGGQDGQTALLQAEQSKKTVPEKAVPAEPSGRIVSNLDEQAAVISIRRGLGMLVKKGDVICELDARPFRHQLLGQSVTVESAKAAYQNARLTREVAEIAVIEYQEGIFVQDLAAVVGDIKVAGAEMALAEEELKAAKEDGADKKLAIKRAELDVFRAKIAMEKAEARRRVLVDYTKGRMIKQLRAEVEKARGDELSKQTIWDLEKGNRLRLEEQIANCTIVAPIGGTIQRVSVHVGEVVRNRQDLFNIVPNIGEKPQDP